ncbi:restriction endonuclease-related protein [Streptomyces sp. NBC_00483]|uniref:pPIWI_RE_Y domain-containing protein n=1 Tax=Streptomyces sp. NBC_00483 TaxID=2975756 RepID=UPI002E18A8FD
MTASHHTQDGNWLDFPDVRLVHTLAGAVIQLADLGPLTSFSLPYPAEAQRALDQTVLTCLLRGVEGVPRSLPELLFWCHSRPLEDWPLDLPPDAFGPGDFLVDPDALVPTQLCHEWWIRAKDAGAAHFDRQVIHTAMHLCRKASSPESYTAFRRLLVDQPVLTGAQRFEVDTDLFLAPLRELVDQCYAPVPAACERAGAYATCGRCLTLLTPVGKDGWWCERDRCRRRGAPPHGRVFSGADAGGLLHLRRPLRQFVTSPGRAEVELATRLGELGLEVQLWPGFDAYDLRVTFPDGHVWALDVKDWKHPGLLGRAAKPVRAEPPFDEACWVVPREQADAHRDYLGTYRRNRPADAGALPLHTDDRIVALAGARLRGSAGPQLKDPNPTNGGPRA